VLGSHQNQSKLIRIYDVIDGGAISVKHKADFLDIEDGVSPVYSPDGAMLAYVRDKGDGVAIVATDTTKVVRRVSPPGVTTRVWFNPTSSAFLLVTASEDRKKSPPQGHLCVWEATTGKERWCASPLKLYTPLTLGFRSGAAKVANDESIEIGAYREPPIRIDLATGKKIEQLPVDIQRPPGSPQTGVYPLVTQAVGTPDPLGMVNIAISANGRMIGIQTEKYSRVISTTSFETLVDDQLQRTRKNAAYIPMRVAFNDDSSLAMLAVSGHSYVWDLTVPPPPKRVTLFDDVAYGEPPYSLPFPGPGKDVVVVERAGLLSIRDAQTGYERKALGRLGPKPSQVRDFLISGDGTRVFVRGEGSDLSIVDASNGSRADVHLPNDWPEMSGDRQQQGIIGSAWQTWTSFGHALVLPMAHGVPGLCPDPTAIPKSCVPIVDTKHSRHFLHDATSIAISKNGAYFAMSDGQIEGYVDLWNATKIKAPEIATVQAGLPIDHLLMPNPNALLTASKDGTLHLYSLPGLNPLLHIELKESSLIAIAPDGRVELLGEKAKARVVCRIGHVTLPFAMCEDRLITPGLLTKSLSTGRVEPTP
jgi:hypothetical protein